MSDKTAAAIVDANRQWLIEHRKTYLSSGGVRGHITDISHVRGHAFTTNCLIKYRGRKSGKTYVTPLIYGDIGGEVVVVGSRGGADRHPVWYLNILACTELEFQIATEAFRATWREPAGAERDKVWAFMVDIYPAYAEYQRATPRQIPLVMMKAIAPAEVFKESDVTGQDRFA